MKEYPDNLSTLISILPVDLREYRLGKTFCVKTNSTIRSREIVLLIPCNSLLRVSLFRFSG